MFNRVGRAFRSFSFNSDRGKAPPLPNEIMDLVHIFSQNIELFETMEEDKEKIRLLNQLITQFGNTFLSIKEEHLQDQEIKKSLQKYCSICGTYGSLVLMNRDISAKMFESISFISGLFLSLPCSKSFINLFVAIVKNSKNMPEILEASYGIITVLFTSLPFFKEFIEYDGFCLVFSSFFIEGMTSSSQAFWINLLFNVIPPSFFETAPASTIIGIFIDTMKNGQNLPYKNCITFITSYFSVFYNSNNNILKEFDECGGLFLLSEFILKNCPSSIKYTFNDFIAATNADKYVIKCLYEIYINEEATPEIRETVLDCYLSNVEKFLDTETNILKSKPLCQWFLRQPLINKECVEKLICFTTEALDKEYISIQEILASLLEMIKPPSSPDTPVDECFSLISSEIYRGKINSSDLIDCRFIEDFILCVPPEQLTHYLLTYKTFIKVITGVYSSPAAHDFRFPMIQSLINVSQSMSDMPSFVQFLSSLFQRNFSTQIVDLLLNFLRNPYITKLLTDEIRKRPEAPELFCEANGPKICVDYVKENPLSAEKILHLLGAAATFGQVPDIDNAINDLSPDHPLFHAPQKTLAEACFAFRNTNYIKIPSLLPYVEDFDTKSPSNAYIVGKYGIKAFEKRGVQLQDIPGIGNVINRYIEKSRVKDFLSLGQLFDAKADCFSLIELQETKKPAVMKVKFSHSSFSFWFKIVTSSKDKEICIAAAKALTVQVINGKLTITTPKEKIVANINNFENEWVNVVISYSVLRANISHVNIYVNGVLNGTLKVAGQQIPNEFVFGDTQGPMTATVLVSYAVCASNSELNQEQAAQVYKRGPGATDISTRYTCLPTECENSAVYVGFLGISSYFTSFVDFESYFEYAERCEKYDDLKNALLGLIALRQCVNFKITEFYTRFCLTLKRKADLISENIKNVIDNIPFNSSTRKRRTKALSIILSDVELFNVLSPEAGVSFLKFSTAALGAFFDINIMEKKGCLQSLIAMMRSGVDEEVSIAACPVIGKLIQISPTEKNIQYFLNIAISSSEWSQGLPISLDDFPISTLLSSPISESPLQLALLSVWTATIKMNTTEFLSFGQLIHFMMLFNDERSLSFAEAICFYSQKNPQYVRSSPLACYAFSHLACLKKTWLCAFAILAGLPYTNTLPHNITIERKEFCHVIVEMLSSLMKAIAHASLFNEESNELSNIATSAFTVLSTIPADQYAFFITPSCIDAMYNLSNLGIIPKSLSVNYSEERVENNWLSFEKEQITKDKIKKIRSFLGENEYTENIFEREEILNAETTTAIQDSLAQFPFDCLYDDWFVDLAVVQNIASFFTSVLFASEPAFFKVLIRDLYQGNSVMYVPYRKQFGRELISQLLINLAGSEEPMENYHKALLIFVKNRICEGAFKDNFIHIFSLVLNLVKSLYMREEFYKFFEDQETLRAYRDILLSAFVYIPKENLNELYQLLSRSKNIIFDPIIFSNITFGSYWMYITKSNDFESEDLSLCMSLFINVFGQENIEKFNPDEVSQKWEEYSASLSVEPELNDKLMMEIAVENIIKKEYAILDDAIQATLMMNVYRTANIYIQANISIQTLNNKIRSLERSFFRYSRLKKSLELRNIDTNEEVSYHLSPISLPLYQPRSVILSPFKVKCPPFDVQTSPEFFAIKYTEKLQRVKQLETNGELLCRPDLCYFHEEGPIFTSPFEYSKVIVQSPKSMLDLFYNAFPEIENAVPLDVGFYHYIHSIPSLLFVSENSVALLILARNNAKGGIDLIKDPPGPIAFLPFTERVALCEWSSSLFCGHIVLLLDRSSIVCIRRHLFIHKPVGLNIYFFMQPALLLSFKTPEIADQTCKLLQKKMLSGFPNYPFLFTMQNTTQAMELWMSGQMTSFDYLLVLNSFGGRSFSDLAQYPIFPWVASPDLEPRNMSLPMGQLNQARAAHYEQTFELTSPQYYYGFHYSLPGAVFWLLMRLPPFTFFGWDLNCGWDEPSRLFFSLMDAWSSAAVKNPSDLKELIPEMYSIPEAFINTCDLVLPLPPKKRPKIKKEDLKEGEEMPSKFDKEGIVELPEWCPNSYTFIDVMRKTLEQTVGLADWIDLIFGFKQTGEAALQAKNVFLPSSYHISKAEDLDMDESVFETQVINFGQCPIQLFAKAHPNRNDIEKQSIALVEQNATVSDCELKNPLSLREFKLGNNAIAIPKLSAMIPPSYSSCVSIQYERICIKTIDQTLVDTNANLGEETFSHKRAEFAFASDISCSEDGLFCAISFLTGLVRIHRVVFESSKAVSLKIVKEMRFDAKVDKTCVLSSDFIAATSLSNGDLILWNIATGLYHRVIHADERFHSLFFDPFGCVLTCVSEKNIYQYTLNGHLLRKTAFEFSLVDQDGTGVLKCSTSSIGMSSPECTCACAFYLDDAFDSRITVCGFSDGTIQFFSVDGSTSELKMIGAKYISKFELVSCFSNPQVCEAFFVDKRNKCFTVKAKTNENVQKRCVGCNAPQTTKCAHCGDPLCDGCSERNGGLCPTCAKDMEYLTQFGL